MMLFSLSAIAQSYHWESCRTLTNNNISYDASIRVDNKGDEIVLGSFSGSMNIDTILLVSQTPVSLFLAKYNNSGHVLWAKVIGGGIYPGGYKVIVNPKGDIFISVSFTDSLNFGLSKYFSKGGKDFSLLKFDSGGNLLWMNGYGTVWDDYILGVNLDRDEHLNITGGFGRTGGSATYDVLFIDSIMLVNQGTGSAFIVQLDGNSKVIWGKTVGVSGNLATIGNSINSDIQGNIFVGGTFNSFTYFDGYRLMGTNVGFVAGNFFLAKYDSLGNFIWAKQVSGSNSGGSTGGSIYGPTNMTLDANGNVYVYGEYGTCTMDFGTTILPEAYGGFNGYFAKYNPEGEVQWAKAGLGYCTSFQPTSLIADRKDNIFLTGGFAGGAIAGDSSDNSCSQTIFVAQVDTNGNGRGMFTAGGFLGGGIGLSLAMDGRSNIYLVGTLYDTVSFDSVTVRTTTNRNTFIAKLVTPSTSATTSTLSASYLCLSPNPANDHLNVKLSDNEAGTILLINSLGQTVLEEDVARSIEQHSINITDLAAGVYSLQWMSGGVRTVKNVVIRH
ncbi:MAG: T9SS type A sorting domain-containing protein [Chitinophagaceae bacterium]